MTEYTFDYMANECSQWAITDGHCCPDGTHKRDCGFIQGHNKTLQKDRDESRPFPFREILMASAFIAAATFFGLSTLNNTAPLCAPTPTCEITK